MKNLLYLLLAICLLFPVSTYGAQVKESAVVEVTTDPYPFDFKDALSFKVARVIDGDTVELEDGRVCRLLGIDAPESRMGKKMLKDSIRLKMSPASIKSYGIASKVYLQELVSGKEVMLQYEKDGQSKDRYDRHLVYLYLKDGTSVNEALLKAGHASVYLEYPVIKTGYYKFIEKNKNQVK